MAKINTGILGPLSGKLGPVTGGSWKGIPYLRKTQRSKSKERTEAQVANEMKFKFINQWLSALNPYFVTGFGPLAIQKTEKNVAYQLNMSAFIGSYPQLSIDYNKVIISKGLLPQLTDLEMVMLSEHELAISWAQSPSPQARYNDQLMLLVYCPELAHADGFIGGTLRAAGICSHRIDPRLIGKTLQVYLSVTSIDRRVVSDSIYLGSINP